MTTKECRTRTFTREELYEFVWTRPATKLANELDCSDVMIGKLCKSFDIPKPYPGYWAQLANRKNPRKTPLPENPDPDIQSLTFHAHDDFGVSVNEPPRELQYDSDILEILEKVRKLGPVEVSSALRNPHPLVAAIKERIEKQIAECKIPWSQRKHDSRETLGPTLSIEVSDGSVKRALRVMDAFIKRLEAIGGSVEVVTSRYNKRRTSTVVIIGGERITVLRLREKHNQVRIKNEDAEYSWDRNRTELVPSGLLLFDDGPSSYRSPLAMDGKSKKVEDKLEGLLLEFVREAGEIRIRRREKEELARQRAEAERLRSAREEELRQRREELERRQAEEQAKLDELLLHAESWQKSSLIRKYLDALCDTCAADGEVVALDSPLAAYLRWGFDQADCLDPLRPSPRSVLDETIEENCVDIDVGQAPRKPR
ncbi:MAG: hypothetical protein H8E44_27795 [Planctomycetes bacterium]|nr:hypothetical protein [Planctomycetota bacterium]MBL7039342.1 hypothetical protein [Pirellulaceae bacterium]